MTSYRYHQAGLAVLFILLLTACSSFGPYGKMTRDPALSEMFLQGELLSEHTYYTAGQPNNAHTILAIKNDYTLNSPQWRQKEFDQATLQRRAIFMRHKFDRTPHGSWVLDDQGNRVGAWFSSAYPTTVRVGEAQELRIMPPRKPLYKNGYLRNEFIN